MPASRGLMARYGAAVAVAVATAARLVLNPALGQDVPYITYVLAVSFAGWYGGLGPGLLSVVLGGAAACLFIEPHPPIRFHGLSHHLGAALFLTVGTIITVLCEAQRRAQRRAESERNWSNVTLASIGDAVIATDDRGRVTFLNRAAESLTGWPSGDAVGELLGRVFRVIDESTRLPVESAAAAVLRGGRVGARADATILVARDGTERPITESASPIPGDGEGIAGIVLVFRDVTDQAQAEEAHTRLAWIVKSSNDAIIGKTVDGVITSWNKGAERLYGFTAGEAEGRHVSFLVPPGRPNDVPELLESVIRGEGVDHYETVRRKKDGTDVAVALSVSPIHNASGRVVGASTIVKDITDRKRIDDHLRRAKEAAEAANKAKDQFLAMLSHELRTPLTPVLLAATAATHDDATPLHLIPTFEMIRLNIELEARLIDDLLDVMRIIRGKMPYRWEVVDAHVLMQRAFEICRSDWQGKRIDLHVDLAATEYHVKADLARLQQVFWNLVKNAVKFTPEGGKVAVRTRNDAGKLVFEIQDSGIGISRDDLPRIFQPFEQAEDPRVGKYGGLGLGLAISRSIAESHGGTLTACSPGLNLGSTFTLDLPTVSPAASVGKPSGTAEGAVPERRALNLLLVEDDLMTSRIMARLLRQVGHTVTTANTLEGALRVASPDFDLVVSDIGLPDGSGLDLMRRINEAHGLCGIALTGFGADEDIERSRQAGFVTHLTKPIDFRRLEEAIQQFAAMPGC